MQGHILSARYEILEPLGRGGFSNTYLAQDLHTGVRCVVKQLALVSNEPKFVEEATRLFNQEAETLLKLNDHPQIPRVIDYFEEENQLYLIQELIEGHTLSSQLHLDQSWTETKVIAMLKDCLGILAAIHEQGVIHRDLKPDNLIIRQEDGKFVLIDFGSVKEFNPQQSQMISQTITVGTRGYMPVEQIQGRPRKSSDLYALGMIAIQALTGRPPMALEETEDSQLIWQPHCTVSPFLAAILNKMIDQDLQQRYSSARQILADLQPKPPPVSTLQTQPREINTAEKEVNFDVLGAIPPEMPSLSPQDTPKLTSNPNFIQKSLVSLRHFWTNLTNSPTFQTLSLALGVGMLATLGVYYFIGQKNKAQQVKIEQIAYQLDYAYDNHRYQDCLTKAQSKETLESGMPEEKRLEFVGKCAIASADLLAHQLKFGEAIAKLDEISAQLDHIFSKLHSSSQKTRKVKDKIKEIQAQIQVKTAYYADALLEQAAQAYTQDGNLSEALSLIGQIPAAYPIKTQALTLSQEWEAEYKRNNLILQEAEQALEYQEWQKAINYAESISRNNLTDYWVLQAKNIIDKAEQGIEKEIKDREKDSQQENSDRPSYSNNRTNNNPSPQGLEVPEEFR